MVNLGLALVSLGGAVLLRDAERAARSTRDRTRPPAPAPRPQPARVRSPLPRTFDDVFARHGNGIPVAYLRALAYKESSFDPHRRSRSSTATGLFQVIDVVRDDYNRIHGTAYARDDLRDPVVNVAICSDLLRRIIKSYARNHPSVPNLREDWSNDRFVELLTQGWNAGWSTTAGVNRVARFLVERGVNDLTIDVIAQHARAAGGVRHLYDPVRLRWTKSVARLHAAERARDAGVATSNIIADTASDSTGGDDFAEPVRSPDQVHAADTAEPVRFPHQVEATA